MLYVALGDSITFGYSSTSDEQRFVSRLSQRLSKQEPINAYVVAKPGWKSKHLLKAVKDVPNAIWDEARLVTLMIGGNDLLKLVPWILDGNASRAVHVADQLGENMSKIIHIAKRPNSVFLVGTLYNPFPNSLLAEEAITTVNKAIRNLSHRESVTLVDVGKSFVQREPECIDGYRRGTIRDYRLIGNPIHPNDTGHEIIAERFAKAFLRRKSKSHSPRQRQTTHRRIPPKFGRA